MASSTRSSELLRGSFVLNAKLALKLAGDDTHAYVKLEADDDIPRRKLKSVAALVRPHSKVDRVDVPERQAKQGAPARVAVAPPPVIPLKPDHLRKPEGTGSSVRLFLRRSLHGFKRHECVACRNAICGETTRLPCGHYYDKTCLLSLVKASTADESLFPPRCCQKPIPKTTFEPFMDGTLATLFSEKTVEFATPKRVYCANSRCSRFLGPKGKGPHHIYTCPVPGCATRTCSRCRVEVKKHVLHSCRPDIPSKQLSQLRGKAGWRQCPGCDRLVELESGCYHVVCVCKTEFCYRCGSKWRTCACPLWEEGYLLSAPERSRAPPVLPPLPRHDRFRDTWIQTSGVISPQNTGQRRDRASAPAQLEARLPVRDSVVVRGVHAQERRGKPKPPVPPRRDEAAMKRHTTVEKSRLTTLEEQVDDLLRSVQRSSCAHKWRIDLMREVCDSCHRKATVIYCCPLCTSRLCKSCQSKR